MSIKHEIRRLCWKLGYDIVPFNPASHSLPRRRRLLQTYGIDVVIDVGANTGQFARQMRTDLGFTGEIVSFEPLKSAFEILETAAAEDPKWRTLNYALGDAGGTTTINVANNSCSSSLLDMLPAHLEAAPESEFVRYESIQITTLDAVFDEICERGKNVYLKIDTQGAESAVLRGSVHSLPLISTIQLEMSLVPLYENSVLFGDMFKMLDEQGYLLVAVEPGFANPDTGQLLQLDGIFHRATRHGPGSRPGSVTWVSCTK